MTKHSIKFDKLHMTFISLFLLSIGLVIGSISMDIMCTKDFDTSKKIIRANGNTFVAVSNISDEFKVELEKDSEFAVFGGKTWIPVKGGPVELIVINDKDCGKKCDTTGAITSLRQQVTPALLVRNLEVTDPEAIELIARFEITTIPQYILGDGIEAHEIATGEKFVEKSAEVLIAKEGKYMIDGAKVRFPIGKFLAAPAFLDLDSEPTLGDGPIRVVEFTDYQCGYCKRLFDQNKDLVKRLIEDGTIEYVMKDFPLNFHKEAMDAHVSANCAQKLGGNESYWLMHDKIFDQQGSWSGKGVGAKTIFKQMAADLALDASGFETCLNDTAMQDEVRADIAEGSKYGVTGTPALFIGKQIMPGAIGPAVFEAAVKEEQ